MPVFAFAVLLLSLAPNGLFVGVVFADWLGHALAYGILAHLMLANDLRDPRRVALAVFVFGAVIEVAQGLTPHRDGSVQDLLANGAGIALALCWHHMKRVLLALVPALGMAGCGAIGAPENVHSPLGNGGYQPSQRAIATSGSATVPDRRTRWREAIAECRPHSEYRRYPALSVKDAEARIARGDLLRITVGGDALLSGEVEIEADGALHMPHMTPLRAAGRSPSALTDALRKALLDQDLYRRPLPAVLVETIERAPVRVHVSGAVFEPGTVEIAMRGSDEKDPLRQLARGDAAHRNGLTAALRGAAGLRPDAELQHILVRRAGRVYRADLHPAIRDAAFVDPMLMPGDEVRVPSLGCFQPALARPTIATRNGVKVHLSNLTQPAFSNAQAGIDDDTREVRYGTTLLQMLVRMNCVGGVHGTNASRFAVHISRNPVTRETEVIERSVEVLVRGADRASRDPVLMPGDAVACYDSKVTNAREMARSFIEVFNPVPFLHGL